MCDYINMSHEVVIYKRMSRNVAITHYYVTVFVSSRFVNTKSTPWSLIFSIEDKNGAFALK